MERYVVKGVKLCKDCKNPVEDEKHSRCEACRKKNRERDREIKEQYLSQGICFYCRTNPVVEGKMKCKSCLAKDVERHKKRYHVWKSEKICVACGKNVAEEGKAMCVECSTARNKESMETRKFYKSIGICPMCKKEPIYQNEKYCYDCSEKKRKQHSEYRKSHKEKIAEYKTAWNKDRATRLTEAGICVMCGKNKVAEGRKRCLTCLVKCREEQRIRNGNYIRRSERPYYGLCYVCGAKIEEGKNTCDRCKKISLKNLEKANEAKSFDNDMFRQMNKLVWEGV